jgi:hypothetical protein
MLLILNELKEWGIKLKNKINQENDKKKKPKIAIKLMETKFDWWKN